MFGLSTLCFAAGMAVFFIAALTGWVVVELPDGVSGEAQPPEFSW
jgi:hypothetical protein